MKLKLVRLAARRPNLWFAAIAVLVLGIGGCVQMGDWMTPKPQVTGQWRELLSDLRAFEERIGFVATKNFSSVTAERPSFPFCGQVSPRYLPYSYEDPAIRWRSDVSEQECRLAASEHDVYYGASEALGEVGTPVTPSMLEGKLDRFVYLVIHEDCHDQFDLPYGIEEALCEVITYRAMAAFAASKFRWYAPENRAVRGYASTQAKLARATILEYERTEALYTRHSRGELSIEALLEQRAALFARAERSLALKTGELNNVLLANHMTYSRHYPFFDRVYETLGSSLPRFIDFFRRVDQAKPEPSQVLARTKLESEKSADFLRAYETEVIDLAKAMLAREPIATPKPGRAPTAVSD